MRNPRSCNRTQNCDPARGVQEEWNWGCNPQEKTNTPMTDLAPFKRGKKKGGARVV